MNTKGNNVSNKEFFNHELNKRDEERFRTNNSLQSNYNEKEQCVVKSLKRLLRVQSNLFIRKVSSVIPQSLQILIRDLTNTKYPCKINEESDYIRRLIEVCEKYLENNQTDTEIIGLLMGLLDKAKKNYRKPNGKGKLTLKNGDIYEGDFEDGRAVDKIIFFQWCQKYY